ncbi:CD59 glycoprotein-like [Mugil cephalus]|uniref:CD59 glycoprotein-like n=1 Tax=Mugil cephalus TaxID=48193 RepID=UPI001FB6E3FF|nr:CD59 glycoprotein-like [Mugil cephalus]
MRLLVSLAVICITLSTASGLKCYTCWGANPGTCNEVWQCHHHFDRCSTTIVSDNQINKQCMRSDMCHIVRSTGIKCCDTDLCNGTTRNGVSVLLLLAPLAIIMRFI